MAEVLEYQLPNLGLLKIFIYPYAKLALDIVNGGNLLAILKINPQLGTIRMAHEGAHHTRWEYVLVQLYIITKLSEKSQLIENKLEGLSNNDPIIGNHRMSGADLLQSWVILLNIGHLYGTFANERGFLYQLSEDKVLRNCLLSGLPKDRRIVEFANKIIVDGDVYSFHKILSYFFINRLRRKYNDKIDLLVSILNLYNFEQSRARERVSKLKAYFRKIRQSAFLFLDSIYGPVPFTFELGQVLLDIENYKKNIFIDEYSELQTALNNFEDLLSESFYLNKISMHSYGNQSRLFANILREKRGEIYKIKTLNAFLKDNNELELTDPMSNLYDLVRFWIDDNNNNVNLSIIQDIRTIGLEKYWNNALPGSRCICTIEKEPKDMMMGITLSIKKDIQKQQCAKICMQILQLISSFQREYNDRLPENGNDYMVFEQSYKDILLYLLNKYWQNIYTMSYIYSENPDFWVLERGTIKTISIIEKMMELFKSQKMHQDRLNEIITLKMAIEDIRHRSVILFTTSQILIKKYEDNSHITDLDTVAVISDSSQLSLLLLEAKNKKNRSVGDAVKKLTSTLNMLGFEPLPEIITIRNHGAFSKVRLCPE
jgi:hypothetical protein